MAGIYDELKKWQYMPRAWEDWKDYRSQLTDWICKTAEKLEEKTKANKKTDILLVGAGACNDYELSNLLGVFHKIYLMDCNCKAMEDAVSRLPEAEQSQIEIIDKDLMGIQEEDYRSFDDYLQELLWLKGKDTQLADLAEPVIARLDRLYETSEKRRVFLKTCSVDFIAVAGVHSQLNNMTAWIWDAYCQALKQREERVFQRIAAENSRWIPLFDRQLIQAARRAVFFCGEKRRVGIPGNIQGASQMFDDIQKQMRLGSVKKLDEINLLWPFDLRQQIIYEMQGIMVAPIRPDHNEDKVTKQLQKQ